MQLKFSKPVLILLIGINIFFSGESTIPLQEKILRRIKQHFVMIARWKGYGEEPGLIERRIEKIAEGHGDRWGKEKLKAELTKLSDAVLADEIVSDVTPEVIDKLLQIIEEIERFYALLFDFDEELLQARPDYLVLNIDKVKKLGGEAGLEEEEIVLFINSEEKLSWQYLLTYLLNLYVHEDGHFKTSSFLHVSDPLELALLRFSLKTKYLHKEVSIFAQEEQYLDRIISELLNAKLLFTIHQTPYKNFTLGEMFQIRELLKMDLERDKDKSALKKEDVLGILPLYIEVEIFFRLLEREDIANELREMAYEMIKKIDEPQRIKEIYRRDYEDAIKDFQIFYLQIQLKPQLLNRLRSSQIQSALHNLWRVILGNQ